MSFWFHSVQVRVFRKYYFPNLANSTAVGFYSVMLTTSWTPRPIGFFVLFSHGTRSERIFQNATPHRFYVSAARRSVIFCPWATLEKIFVG